MANALGNYQFHELEFAKDGSLVHPEQATDVGALAGQVTDLIVMSHGWNNDMNEARSLYATIAASFDQVRAGGHEPHLDGRSIAIVGILWPSKRFADSDLIAGGAAGLEPGDPTLAADLLAMRDAFDVEGAAAILKRAAALVPTLDSSPPAQREYADLLRSLISRRGGEPADALDQFFRLDGDDLLQRLDAATLDDPGALPPLSGQGGTGGVQSVPGGGLAGGPGGGTGSIAGFGLGELASKGRMLLNCITYYEMKARAGTIGAKSVGPILTANVVGRTRLHLVGHSFGARLVTAAAAAISTPQSVHSLNLLQAAFSHNSFARQWQPGHDGAFRPLITSNTLAGPVIVTHTRNDTAVGLAYAMASRIAGQNDSAIGDKDSPYGGLGSNGAQHTPEALDDQDLADVGFEYRFQAGRVHNLLADKYISGHSDIAGVQVANAVLQSVAATITA